MDARREKTSCCDLHPRRRCHAAWRAERHSVRRRRACGGVRRDDRDDACRCRWPPSQPDSRRPLHRRRWRFRRAFLRRHREPVLAPVWSRPDAALRDVERHSSSRCARTSIPVCAIRSASMQRVQPASAPDARVANLRRVTCSISAAQIWPAVHSAGACGANRRRDRDHCGVRHCATRRRGVRTDVRGVPHSRVVSCVVLVSALQGSARPRERRGTSRTDAQANCSMQARL